MYLYTTMNINSTYNSHINNKYPSISLISTYYLISLFITHKTYGIYK